MNERIRLQVLGISYSQIQSGAYALILAQAGGPYRIPVVIGAAEAQSIAMRMESITPPTISLSVSPTHSELSSTKCSSTALRTVSSLRS